VHYFILSIFLLNFAIADPGLTQKFIQSIKSGNFEYNPETGIVRCKIQERIDGWLKLTPGISPEKVLEVLTSKLKSNSIRYHGPTGPTLVLFKLDADAVKIESRMPNTLL
jgi:hypothetical protein